MFNGIEDFGKVQFQEENFFLGSLTLVYVFESPGQTVMNGSSTKKAILIFMHHLKNNVLKAAGQNFSDQLQTAL